MTELENLTQIMYDLFLIDYADHEPQQFYLMLDPVPASRPRVGKNVYFAERYKAFKENAIGPCNSFMGRKSDKPIACFAEYVIQPTKNFSHPYPIGDVDNYNKAVLDAMVHSGMFFKDDVQIVFLTSTKRYVKGFEEVPHISLVWFDIDM